MNIYGLLCGCAIVFVLWKVFILFYHVAYMYIRARTRRGAGGVWEIMPDRPPSTMQRARNLQKAKRSPKPDVRLSAAKRGYDHIWRSLRAAHLSVNRLCVHCLARGEERMADEVDHIIPHRGDVGLLRDPSNLQSLCKTCHSRKTRSGA